MIWWPPLPLLAVMSGVMSAPGQYFDLMNNNYNNGQSYNNPSKSFLNSETTSKATKTTAGQVTTEPPQKVTTKKIPVVTSWPMQAEEILIPNKPGSEKFTNVPPKSEQTSESRPLDFKEMIDDNQYDDLLSYLGLDRLNMKQLKNLKKVKNVDGIIDDEDQRHLAEELGVDVKQVKTILTLSKTKSVAEALEKDELVSTLENAGVNTKSLKEVSKISKLKMEQAIENKVLMNQRVIFATQSSFARPKNT